VVSLAKAKETSDVDFPDEEIRVVLRNIADLYELNLVVPDTLQGRTSLKLSGVTWRQIFKVVLSPVGYTFVEDGNIIKIVSQDSLEQEPFVTESIILDNVGAASIKPLVEAVLTPAQAATATAPAIAGGSIVVNPLANELIVTDRAAVVKRIFDTVKRLDTEPRQVVIETKFIELTRENTTALGVRLAGQKHIGQGGSAGTAGLNTLGQSLLSAPSNPVGSGSFNAVLTGSDYTAFLTAIDSMDGSRLVSSPTIVAINGSKSDIRIGTDFQTVNTTVTTSTTGTTITFAAGEKLFQGVKIEVTPQITSTKLVSLSLKTVRSEAKSFVVGTDSATTAAQTFYNMDLREGTLNMLLKDGQTAAIGGLMSTTERKVDEKVPFLGDIPILGNLFKSKATFKDDTNLIIFITANILEPSKTTYLNVATKAQVDELGVTDRDIKGVNYKESDEEKRLYAEAKAVRTNKQDAELAARLKASATVPPVKKK
jgi:type IV pilus assembly protein PilQ